MEILTGHKLTADVFTTTRDFEKGKLQMPIVAHRIRIIDHARAKTTGNCITLGLCKFVSGDMIVQVSDPTVLPKDPAEDDGCVSPFWSVRTTAEQDEAIICPIEQVCSHACL